MAVAVEDCLAALAVCLEWDNKMKKRNQINKKRGALALSQIFLLIISIIAISYAIGSEVGIVSGATPSSTKTTTQSSGGGCEGTCRVSNKCKDTEQIGSGKCSDFLWAFPQACCVPKSTPKTDTSTKTGTVCDKNNCFNRCCGSNICYGKCSNGNGNPGTCVNGPVAKTCPNGCENAACKTEKVIGGDKEELGGEDDKLSTTNNPVYNAEQTQSLRQECSLDGGSCKSICDLNTEQESGQCSDTEKCCISISKTAVGDTTTGDKKTCTGNGGTCKPSCEESKETNLPRYDCKAPSGACCQASAGTKGVLGGLFNVKKGGFMDAIMTGSTWGAIIGAAIYFIGPMLGLEQELVDAASMAVGVGVGVGQAVSTLLTEQMGSQAAGMVGMGVGAAVGIALFIMNYVKQKQEIITFTCYPWQAPTGGESCEECNKQGILPCSEYQCRSLGQACQLLNKGTDQEKCAWVNKNDVKFPVIEAWNDALLKNYEYRPDNAVSPPDRGVKVYNTESSTGCVPAFTPLSFGVSLDEPAKCKIDGIRKQEFEEMDFFFSGSLSLYNHSYVLSLPGPTALKEENITIGTNGEFRLYVRCQDANGNANTADFEISFCVEKGPDTTPPLIVSTNPLNGKPIAYNQSVVGTTVYVNEPAKCKWSHLDEEYDNMEGNMSCSSSIFEMNAQMLYTCETDLTGLKDKQENKFYMRCKDNAGNINKESYEFTLIGTQPLVINSIKPENGTLVKDSSDSVKVTLEVETTAGYKEGEAHCYYSSTGATEDYVMFYNTNSHLHSQDLWLVGGHYEYAIKCIDLGGNSDIEIINFNVESDSASPMIVRAYHEETYLKIVTNEPARCVYDTKYENYPCDYPFDDGTPLTAVDDVNHYTTWDTASTLYIVCQDEYGNQPAPNECSIIVRPSSEFASTV